MIIERNLLLRAGQPHVLHVYFSDSDGAGVTGAAPDITMWRSTDGHWFDGIDWDAAESSMTAVEKGQGWYTFTLDIPQNTLDAYYIVINESSAESIKAYVYNIAVSG